MYWYNGSVYIFENKEAYRVKVGATTNDVALRLRDVNAMWQDRKVTCQICGGRRLVNRQGLMPSHSLSGHACPGSQYLPFEKETDLAEWYLDELENGVEDFMQRQQGTVIKTLRKRIDLFRNYKPTVGRFKVASVFITPHAFTIEEIAHEQLSEFLDKSASFGEVFNCSVEIAAMAVKEAMENLKIIT